MIHKKHIRTISNSELKEINTVQELMDILKTARKHGIQLYSKRSGKYIYDISEVDNKKVNYVYSDGKSTGESKVENMYKYFEFK
ncbi:MAG: hypothetical protein ACOC5T_10000 [Elusimicrobiota bacterium]